MCSIKSIENQPKNQPKKPPKNQPKNPPTSTYKHLQLARRQTRLAPARSEQINQFAGGAHHQRLPARRCTGKRLLWRKIGQNYCCGKWGRTKYCCGKLGCTKPGVIVVAENWDAKSGHSHSFPLHFQLKFTPFSRPNKAPLSTQMHAVWIPPIVGSNQSSYSASCL